MGSDTHMRGTPWGASRAHVTTLLYGPHPVGGDRTRLCRRGVSLTPKGTWGRPHTHTHKSRIKTTPASLFLLLNVHQCRSGITIRISARAFIQVLKILGLCGRIQNPESRIRIDGLLLTKRGENPESRIRKRPSGLLSGKEKQNPKSRIQSP